MHGVRVGLVVSIAHGAIFGKLHAIFGVPNGHSIGPTRFAPQQFALPPPVVLGVGGGHAFHQWFVPMQATMATPQPCWPVRALHPVLLFQTCATPRFGGTPALVTPMRRPLAMGAVVAGVACPVDFELWCCCTHGINCLRQLQWFECDFVGWLKHLRESFVLGIKSQFAVKAAIIAALTPPSWWFACDIAHPAS